MWKGYQGHISALIKFSENTANTYFVTYQPWSFYATMTDFCHCKRDHVTCKTPKFTFLSAMKLFAYRCLQRSFFQGNGLYCSPPFARRRQTQWHSKRATRIPLLASWPSTCVILNSWRACFSHLIPYDWADPSSKLICSHEGWMMAAKGRTGLLRCP